MPKPHKDSNVSPKKGRYFIQLLKKILSDPSEKDKNHAPMSSNYSSPHNQIESPVASIPTPSKNLQEPSISSSSKYAPKDEIPQECL